MSYYLLQFQDFFRVFLPLISLFLFSAMLSQDSIRTIVGVTGNCISLVLFLSPVPTFMTIWKKKAVEQYSPVPYVATFMNCGLWVVYGLPMVKPDRMLVLTINAAGFGIEIVYLSLFLIFSVPKKRLRLMAVVVVECIFIVLLAFLVLSLTHTHKLRSIIVGSICMVATIGMYAAPLSVMKLVISSKSVEYMPFSLSLFSFINGLCWTAYSFIGFDAFVLIPNGIGTLLGLAQLVIYATYYKSTQRVIAQRKAEGEVDMAKMDPDRNSGVNGV